MSEVLWNNLEGSVPRGDKEPGPVELGLETQTPGLSCAFMWVKWAREHSEQCVRQGSAHRAYHTSLCNRFTSVEYLFGSGGEDTQTCIQEFPTRLCEAGHIYTNNNNRQFQVPSESGSYLTQHIRDENSENKTMAEDDIICAA